MDKHKDKPTPKPKEKGSAPTVVTLEVQNVTVKVEKSTGRKKNGESTT